MAESIRVDGTPVPRNYCVQVDHTLTTFVVVVRSMNKVGPDTIKDLIEKKFEVVEVKQTDNQWVTL